MYLPVVHTVWENHEAGSGSVERGWNQLLLPGQGVLLGPYWPEEQANRKKQVLPLTPLFRLPHCPLLEEPNRKLPNRRKTASEIQPQPKRAVDLEQRDHSLINSTPSHWNIFSVLLTSLHLDETLRIIFLYTPSPASSYSWDMLRLFGSRLLTKSSFYFKNPYEQL